MSEASVSGAAVSLNLSQLGSNQGVSRRRDKHQAALDSIRKFLRERSSYDVLPVSFRLVVLDTKLVVKPALDIMWQTGIVSAPLWQSSAATDMPAADEEGKPIEGTKQAAGHQTGFAGMFTVNDIIHLIQFYYKNSSYGDAEKDVETFRLEKLKGESNEERQTRESDN